MIKLFVVASVIELVYLIVSQLIIDHRAHCAGTHYAVRIDAK